MGGAVGLGLLALVVWSVLTGGNKSSPSSQAPAAAPPVATPAANGNPAIASEFAAGIDDVYCGSGPMPEWCQAISRIAGKPDVYVELPVAFVGFHVLSDTVAESTCRDLVAIHYDANAVDLGITSVIIVGPGNQKMAECRKSD